MNKENPPIQEVSEEILSWKVTGYRCKESCVRLLKKFFLWMLSGGLSFVFVNLLFRPGVQNAPILPLVFALVLMTGVTFCLLTLMGVMRVIFYVALFDVQDLSSLPQAWKNILHWETHRIQKNQAFLEANPELAVHLLSERLKKSVRLANPTLSSQKTRL